ncbi:hypothetical protein DEU56DRAFT_807735 [Suillus clintonianus]|uniref:uncharacterized protein n=1 Tax=Suillus clintonianus TaxID=1904413 RepID=UPI001B8625AA|nr:uncharacterized protein DEU56DRAFT_807735 [Suillus clintonianus]KAG2135092.1 hypothetical protein DEU56DRAFT_807735 [Suillus clintonianus]
MSSTATTSSSVSHLNLLSLYHVLWQQQDYAVVRQLKCNVTDLEEQEQVHPFKFDAIDLSRCPGATLPNGATSMIIRPVYETFFHKISNNERNIVVHGSAGIGKTYFLLYVLVRRLLARKPVTYQVDQPGSSVLCFTADGFFALPEENSEYHSLFQCEDVLHLIDSTQEDTITHLNTEHTRALMRGSCGKAVFATFWPDSLGLDVEWLSDCDIVLRKWMKPCTFDEIFAMSVLTSGQHDAKSLRWSYIHFGSNAHACLQISRHASDADHYLKELERAHDDLWTKPPILREPEAQYNRNLFAVEPGKTCAEPLSFPVSQVATRLFAGEITSVDSAGAKETANTLLNSEDTKEAGEIFYRQAVVALMSRFGGTFTLGRPDLQGHYHLAQEELVLRTKTHLAHEEQRAMPSSFIYSTQRELAMLAEYCPQLLHTPQHALVHPGIDAIMFDSNKLTVWLVQVTHGTHGTSRPVSPEGLIFLLDVVRGSPYEPSPTHPWQFIYATRGQSTKTFYLSGKERTQRFSMGFWLPRIKPYIMQLRDTDREVHSSSKPYEQWGLPYKAPQKSSPSLPRRLANSLAHLVPRSRSTTESNITVLDKMTSEINGAIIRNSGVPGAQLLGEIVKEQYPGPLDHYVRDVEQTNSWVKRWAEVCR